MGRGGTPRAVASAEGTLEIGVAGRGGSLDLRWAAVDVTAAVEEARRLHDLSPVATSALGRALAGAALLRALATGSCRRLTLRIDGDGPLGRVVAEADSEGNLRGRVANPRPESAPEEVEVPPSVARAVGGGLLRVIREGGDGALAESQVRLVAGTIGVDLAHYLEQSEQTGSAVLVGVLLGPEGVRTAGGLVVELIPAAQSASVERLEANLAALGSVSRRLAAEGIAGLASAVLAGLESDVREREAVRFRCRCSREALAETLRAMTPEQRAELADTQGEVEAECAYCGVHYLFSRAELGI